MTVVAQAAITRRLLYYRFKTDAVGWCPGVNVLVPHDYETSGLRYPVLYMFHGGGLDQDFRFFDRQGVPGATEDAQLIIVMPDGGHAGWYSDPVHSPVGPRNWETFHIHRLIPWVDANFRTLTDGECRAVGGFSMGGFGALKYMVKHRELFASVSSHSGPASLRHDLGIIVHWANLSSAAIDLAGGTIYGALKWDLEKINADDPLQHAGDFAGKRVFLVAGKRPNPVDWFDSIHETQVKRSQELFIGALTKASVKPVPIYHFVDGGHEFRLNWFEDDLVGILDTLRTATGP